jgi:hypothetical protein
MRWRATVCAGELEYAGQELPPLSMIEGESAAESTEPPSPSDPELCLRCVLASLVLATGHRSAAPTGPPNCEITIFFDCLANDPNISARTVARFDVLREENHVFASILVEGIPRFDVGPLKLSADVEPWDIVQGVLEALFPPP